MLKKERTLKDERKDNEGLLKDLNCSNTMWSPCIPNVDFSVPASGDKLLWVQRMVHDGEHLACVSVAKVRVLTPLED